MQYQVYKDASGHWRWRLLAANYKIIADSAESYWTQSDCVAGINLVKSSSQAPVYQV